MSQPYRRVEADGTRIYASYNRYKPVPMEQRKIGVNRPQDPRAVRVGARWFLPLDLRPDEERTLPPTRPDTDAYDHMGKRGACGCAVCKRPESERWKRKWRRDQGLRA